MSKQRKRKIDIAWQKICERTKILQQIDSEGFFRISAKDVDRHSDREQARLLAKMDSNDDRPSIFREHNLNILPLNRGEYVVFRDRKNVSYASLPVTDLKPMPYPARFPIDSLDTLAKGISKTESDAIDTIFLSSLLESFAKTTNLKLTKRGRFGSSEFSLNLPECSDSLTVKGSQLEVDAIYESNDAVVLIESKAGFPEDFTIRQLYYPYLWLKARTHKRIVPIFLGFANDEYQLTEFALGEKFGDFSIVQNKRFVLDQYVLARADIEILLRNSPSSSENLSVPFPQANSLDRVVEIVDLASRGFNDKAELAEIFGFDPRQSYYYTRAAKYLELLNANGHPTELGKSLLSQPHRLNRTELILKSLLRTSVFRQVLLVLKQRNYEVDALQIKEIATVILAARPELVARTSERRASTVKTWLRWLVANCDFKPTL
jgi:hypothetical protein